MTAHAFVRTWRLAERSFWNSSRLIPASLRMLCSVPGLMVFAGMNRYTHCARLTKVSEILVTAVSMTVLPAL